MNTKKELNEKGKQLLQNKEVKQKIKDDGFYIFYLKGKLREEKSVINGRYLIVTLKNKGFLTKKDHAKRKNDINWLKLFTKYDILAKIKENGYFKIKSKQINKFRQSRLMAKFDHSSNLPDVFLRNELSILPISRGKYIITKSQAYEKINYKNLKPIRKKEREDLESLNSKNIYSESAALNYAHATGIIEDLVGEPCDLTINGRMSTNSFKFLINGSSNISVKNSQCEIDAGFESKNKLVLIEAKNTSCDDFLIRQLYYPFRLWKREVTKDVIPIFMTYSNDKYSFFIYKFEDPESYNSLRLVEQRDFIVSRESITMEDIKKVFINTKIITEPKVPFPQADNFSRVIDLFGLLTQKQFSVNELTENYDFVLRQSDYYFNAGRYLGMVKKVNSKFLKLTKEGKKVMKLNHKEKNMEIIRKILKHRPFKLTLEYYFENLVLPTKKKIVDYMKKANIYQVKSESTYKRRAQTVRCWIEWIINMGNKNI